MSVAFPRTLRSLDADRMRPSVVGAVVAVAFVVAWVVWFFVAEVGVFEVTSEARIEVGGSAHVVQAPVAGRVVAVDMAVDQPVARGHALVVLETSRETSRVAEEVGRAGGLNQRVEALKVERQAEIEVAASARNALAEKTVTAQARHREAQAVARLADSQLARSTDLYAKGLVSEADLEAAEVAVEERRAEVEAQWSELARLMWQGEQEDNEHLLRLAEIGRRLATVRGDLSISEEAVKRVDHDLSQRVIRSPISGRLGEVVPLRPGSVVEAGERVVVVVPDGKLIVVARFPVASALGRIRPDQEARLRLDAFPWTQFGELDVVVRRVASEASDGRIRVELDLLLPSEAPGDPSFPAGSATGQSIPLQHGLSGTLVVLVEKVSPANLTLRAAGRRLQSTRSSEGTP